MTLLLLLACGPSPDELACREGFERADDGRCYPPASALPNIDLEAALEHMPPCEPLTDGVAMDLESGCAYGLCPGDTFAEALELFGEGYDCFDANNDAYCLWEHVGIEGRWDDEDDDGLPDEGAGNVRTHVAEGSLARTEGGLGLQVPLSCYFEQLGPPDTFTVIDTVDGLMIEFMDWDDVGLLAYDLVDRNGYVGPDGLVDDLYLYGAP
jgi:hypothetical protein